VKRPGAGGVVGVGAIACGGCCAGPILAFLGAIGLGTVVGVAIFGLVGLLLAVLVCRRSAQVATLRPIRRWLPLGSVSVNSCMPHGMSCTSVTRSPAAPSRACHPSVSPVMT
jgi:hypothetical protein